MDDLREERDELDAAERETVEEEREQEDARRFWQTHPDVEREASVTGTRLTASGRDGDNAAPASWRFPASPARANEAGATSFLAPATARSVLPTPIVA